MTVLEVLSFSANAEILVATERMLRTEFVWLDISQEVILQSAKNRRTKKIKSPNAIIGATAICHQLILVTANTKDFSAFAARSD